MPIPDMDDQAAVQSATNVDSSPASNTPAVPLPGQPPQTVSNGQPQNAQPQSGQPAKTNPANATGAPAQPQTPANPAAKKASWIAETADLLSGGPQYKTTFDPQTNQVTRTKLPPSGKNIAMALVLHALEGSLAGGGAKGPNAVGEAGAAGLKQGEQIKAQNRQQDQDEVAAANEQFRQHAATINGNLEARKLAVSLSDHDAEWNQKIIDNSKPLFDKLMEAGAIQPGTEQGLSEDEITQRMGGDGHAFAKLNGIPVGSPEYVRDPKGNVVKDADGVPKVQLKYALLDPSYKITMPAGMEDMLKYWSMPGFVSPASGDTHPALKSTPVSAGAYIQAQQAVNQLETAQKELTDYATENGLTVGTGKGQISPNVLRDAIKAGTISRSDILSLESVEGGHPVDVELNLLAKSNPQAAGRVAALYNSIYPTSKYGEDRAARVELDKKNKALTSEPITTPDQAQAVIASKNSAITTDRRQEAKDFLSGVAGQAENIKSKELQDTRDIQDKDINEAAANIVKNPADTTAIKSVASMRGDERLRLYNAIHKLDPNYDTGKIDAKVKVLNDFADGKAADNIVAYNTFLGHAVDASDAVNQFRGTGGNVSPLINRGLNWLDKNATNDPTYAAFKTALIPVQKEFMSFLNNNRAEHEADIEDMRTVIDPNSTPAQIQATLKKLAQSGDIRLTQLGNKYKNTMGVPYENLYSPEGKAALSKLIGKTTPPNPADVVKTGNMNGKKVFQLKNGQTVYADGTTVGAQ